jgi:hypothetical protein
MNRVLKAALQIGCVSLLGGLSQGAFAQQAYISQTITLAANFCPQGFVPMQGQLLQIARYQVLFSLIGTAYGGDGRTTFALPEASPIPTKNGPRSCNASPSPAPCRHVHGAMFRSLGPKLLENLRHLQMLGCIKDLGGRNLQSGFITTEPNSNVIWRYSTELLS